MSSRTNSIKDLILFYEKTYGSRPANSVMAKEAVVNSSLYRKHSLYSNAATVNKPYSAAISSEVKSDAAKTSAIQPRIRYAQQCSAPLESTTTVEQVVMTTQSNYRCFSNHNCRAFSISPSSSLAASSTVSSSSSSSSSSDTSSSSSSTSSVEKIAATTDKSSQAAAMAAPPLQAQPLTLTAPHIQPKQAATLIVNDELTQSDINISPPLASYSSTSSSPSSNVATTFATKPNASINRRKHTSFYLPSNTYSFSVPPKNFHCLPRKSADNAASSSATLRNPNLVAERPRSHLAQSSRFDPRNVQKVVLEWCQNRTANYPNVKITNFSSSWSDGLAFCALIHSFMPDSFDYNKLNTHNKRYNFELAFETAYKQANIVPLLEASDMLLMGSRPDEKCVFTYLSTIYTRFNSNKANGANSSNSSNSSSTNSSTSDIQ